MSSSQFDLEEEIFSTALKLENAEKRKAYLEEACGEDRELRRQVAELLEAHQHSGSFLDREPTATSGREDSAGEKPGDYIGPYRLVAQIGEGGFGVVYKAEQERPLRRTVALKIIKLGMDTRQVVARFEAERQALALMDHPNIAKVLDAGATPSGRPYFIMELVEGVPITDYCDREQLPAGERLELFARVCQAVEHAHQKGIVHRDLKPSNILVRREDGTAVPKVIDFGIAKALEEDLTEKTLVTRVHQLVGTPAYMSPEQASFGGRDVDTRTDIYSLGVLLYELLTGRTPFDSRALEKADLGTLSRTVQETDPPKPSTRFNRLTPDERTSLAVRRRSNSERLGRLLRGELDWIAMKALEKDRSRRYQSASGLAEDVQRYLRDEPVSAGAPSTRYRLRKFIVRNKAACFTAVSVAAMLVAGTAISIGLAVRATDAEGRVEGLLESERAARLAATEELRQSYLANARAGRFSQRIGQKFDGLEAIRKAASIRPSLELRNEAIACLAVPDLKLVRTWKTGGLSRDFKFADPSLRKIVGIHKDGTVRVFDLDENRELFVLPGEGVHSHSPQFSPDGRYLSVRYRHWKSWRPMKVWDLQTRKPVLELPMDSGNPATDFVQNGSGVFYAVGTEDRAVAIYELPSGRKIARLPIGFPVYQVRFSPDGRLLALWSRSAKTPLQIWEWREEEIRKEIAVHTQVYDVAWSPDGRRLAAAGADSRVRLWNWPSAAESLVLEGHQAEAVHVSFNESGSLVLSASWDGTLRLWETRTGGELLTGPAATLAASEDGRVLTREGDHFRLFEIATSAEHALLHDPPLLGKDTIPVFPPGGEFLCSPGPQGVRIWSARDQRVQGRLPTGLTRAVLFDPDGKCWWTVGTHGIHRWAVEVVPAGGSTVPLVQFGPPETVTETRTWNHAVLSRDGQYLIGADRGRVRLIDAESGVQVASMPGQPGLGRLDLHPAGRWLVGSNWKGRGVRVWDLDTYEVDRDLLEDEPNVQAQFSPDGKTLVTGDGQVYRFWEVGTWRPTVELPRRDGTRLPGVMAFSFDGRYGALAITRFAVALVEMATGRVLAEFEPPDLVPIKGLAFSPDGRSLAVGTVARTIQIWNLGQVRTSLAELELEWDAPALARARKAPRGVRGAVVLAAAAERDQLVAKDEFNGAFSADWEIREASAEHYSLSENAGALTVTAQAGGIYGPATNYRNLFLLRAPMEAGVDFEATLRIRSFEPAEPTHQVALVLFQDEDHYVKWSWNWHQRLGRPVLMINHEKAGRILLQRAHVPTGRGGEIALRVTRMGQRCVFSWSGDGENYEQAEFADFALGSDGPIRVGWIAKNGSGSSAAEIPAVIESFELWSLQRTVGGD